MATALTFASGPSRPARPTVRVLSALAAACAAILVVAALSAPGREDGAGAASANTIAVSPVVAVFTGDFDRGAPVYRLPPVEVVGHRAQQPARRVVAARSAALM